MFLAVETDALHVLPVGRHSVNLHTEHTTRHVDLPLPQTEECQTSSVRYPAPTSYMPIAESMYHADI